MPDDGNDDSTGNLQLATWVPRICAAIVALGFCYMDLEQGIAASCLVVAATAALYFAPELRVGLLARKGLLLCGRMLLSVHFLTELYDKLHRFEYWVIVCRESGQPFPVLEMLLVTVLLLFGAPCLLVGRKVPQACLALFIFQVPTTIFFESTLYTQFDSVSVIGGLLIAAATDWDAMDISSTIENERQIQAPKSRSGDDDPSNA